MVTLPPRVGWVWQDPPGTWPAGLDAVLVRAANGAGTTGSGVDYARSYAAWARAFPGRVLPWTWVGPPASGNGAACADALHSAAPGAPLYVADIEGALPAGEAAAFCARMRRHEPGCLLGFSSYPTRSQATAHGVPWDACVAAFDAGLPQVYFASQRARMDEVIAGHKGLPVHVAVSPGDDAGWLDAACAGMAQAGVSVWRYGLSGFDGWARALASLTAKEDDMGYADWTDADKQALRDDLGKLIKVLVTEGDNPVPPGGQTHPNSLKQVRADIAKGLTDTQLAALADRLAPLLSARVEIAGMPTLTITGEATPKAPPA